jgi:uncharacterized protein YecE (DUF72 family)
MSESMIRVGCCGFRMAQKEYVRRFPAVEVQQTFYQPPSVATLRRWRDDAPESFEFTLKAWMLITHEARSPTYRRLKRKLDEQETRDCGSFRATPVVLDAWATTRACAEALAARCVLFQCPASFRPTEENVENMREFFAMIDRGGLRCLWEPRGEWDEETIAELCGELDLGHVVDPFAATSVTPEFCYFRLHGRTGYRYVYEEFELEELYTMLPALVPSYVFFNNIKMVQDAGRFLEITRRRG